MEGARNGLSGRTPRYEWPTIFLIIGCHASWAAAGFLLWPHYPIASLVGRKRFLFVLVEPGRATLAAADRGAWCSVSNSPLAEGDDALAALIGRELQLIGDGAPTEVLVHAPRVASESLARVEAAGWQLIPAGGGADYAMAWGTRPR